jgi:uncharacterized membrane protein
MMEYGKKLGCHQMAERSFAFRNYQFPICARCTGLLIGYILAVPLFFIYQIPFYVIPISCFIMFVDWFLQYKMICQSTNIRRVVTGTLCGMAIMSFQLTYIKKLLILIFF